MRISFIKSHVDCNFGRDSRMKTAIMYISQSVDVVCVHTREHNVNKNLLLIQKAIWCMAACTYERTNDLLTYFALRWVYSSSFPFIIHLIFFISYYYYFFYSTAFAFHFHIHRIDFFNCFSFSVIVFFSGDWLTCLWWSIIIFMSSDLKS